MTKEKFPLYDDYGNLIGIRQNGVVVYNAEVTPQSPYLDSYQSKYGYNLYYDNDGSVSSVPGINPQTGQPYQQVVHVHSVEQAVAFGEALVYQHTAGGQANRLADQDKFEEAQKQKELAKQNGELLKSIVAGDSFDFKQISQELAKLNQGADLRVWQQHAAGWEYNAQVAKMAADPNVHRALMKTQGCQMTAVTSDQNSQDGANIWQTDLSKNLQIGAQGAILASARNQVIGDESYRKATGTQQAVEQVPAKQEEVKQYQQSQAMTEIQASVNQELKQPDLQSDQRSIDETFEIAKRILQRQPDTEKQSQQEISDQSRDNNLRSSMQQLAIGQNKDVNKQADQVEDQSKNNEPKKSSKQKEQSVILQSKAVDDSKKVTTPPAGNKSGKAELAGPVEPGKTYTISLVAHNPKEVENNLFRSQAKYRAYHASEYAGEQDNYMRAAQLRFEDILESRLRDHHQMVIHCSFGAGSETAFTRAAVFVKHKNPQNVKLVADFNGPESFASRAFDVNTAKNREAGLNAVNNSLDETKLLLNQMDQVNLYGIQKGQDGKNHVTKTVMNQEETRNYLHGNPSEFEKHAEVARKLCQSKDGRYSIAPVVYWKNKHDQIDQSHEVLALYDQSFERTDKQGQIIKNKKGKPMVQNVAKLVAYAQREVGKYDVRKSDSIKPTIIRVKEQDGSMGVYLAPSDRMVYWPGDTQPMPMIIDHIPPQDIDNFATRVAKQNHLENDKELWKVTEHDNRPLSTNLVSDQPKYKQRVLESFFEPYTPNKYVKQRNRIKINQKENQQTDQQLADVKATAQPGDYQVEANLTEYKKKFDEPKTKAEKAQLTALAKKQKAKHISQRIVKQATAKENSKAATPSDYADSFTDADVPPEPPVNDGPDMG